MEKDNRQTPEDKFRYYSGAIRRDMGNLLKWLLLAVVVGCIAGAFSTLFSFVLKAVTGYRKAHLWTFFLLPLFGLCIVFLYEKFGKDDGGTNQVLSTVRSQDDVPWRSGPLIVISTALTVVQQDVRVQLFSWVAALPIFLADGSILMRKTVM